MWGCSFFCFNHVLITEKKVLETSFFCTKFKTCIHQALPFLVVLAANLTAVDTRIFSSAVLVVGRAFLDFWASLTLLTSNYSFNHTLLTCLLPLNFCLPLLFNSLRHEFAIQLVWEMLYKIKLCCIVFSRKDQWPSKAFVQLQICLLHTQRVSLGN